MKFPGINTDAWDDLTNWQRSYLIAYHEVRTIEEHELMAKQAEAMLPMKVL